MFKGENSSEPLTPLDLGPSTDYSCSQWDADQSSALLWGIVLILARGKGVDGYGSLDPAIRGIRVIDGLFSFSEACDVNSATQNRVMQGRFVELEID